MRWLTLTGWPRGPPTTWGMEGHTHPVHTTLVPLPGTPVTLPGTFNTPCSRTCYTPCSRASSRGTLAILALGYPGWLPGRVTQGGCQVPRVVPRCQGCTSRCTAPPMPDVLPHPRPVYPTPDRCAPPHQGTYRRGPRGRQSGSAASCSLFPENAQFHA